MSLEVELQSLASLFRQITDLNRRAMDQLRQGQPPRALETLFRAKQGVAEALGRGLEALARAKSGVHTTDEAAAVAACTCAQTMAAELEAQLAEALGNTVSRSGKASVYRANAPIQAQNRLDQSV